MKKTNVLCTSDIKERYKPDLLLSLGSKEPQMGIERLTGKPERAWINLMLC